MHELGVVTVEPVPAVDAIDGPGGPGDAQDGGASDGGRPGRRRGRRRSLVILLTLIVVAGLAVGGTVLARPPHLVPGSLTYAPAPGLTVANDGYQETEYVIDGNRGGQLIVSVSNAGKVPITITGLARTFTMSPLARIQFRANLGEPDHPALGDPPAADRLTLSPGHEATVILTVATPRCAVMQGGGAYSFMGIPVTVRRLGFTRTTTIPLPLPLRVNYAGNHEPTGSC